jgi:uncharacterized protein DUF5686/carboxypeptidase-like protein
MNNRFARILLLAFTICFFPLLHLQAQTLSGYVYDQDNVPMPFVNIMVKSTATGTSTDKKGHFNIDLLPGDYELVFSFIGYTSKTLDVIMSTEDQTRNLWMDLSTTQLEQIVIRSNRKDPAFEIIQKVIKNKEKYLAKQKGLRVQVYVKATEEKVVQFKQKKKETFDDSEPLSANEVLALHDEQIQKKDTVEGLSLIEMNMTLNVMPPKKYKEERTGYSRYGATESLFIPQFAENDFNFYKNTVSLKGIAEAPIISPISKTAIIAYKYKLVDILNENGQVVYNIKVIPRKKGNSTVSGHIYINDSIWNIRRLDFSVYKSGLRFYDVFALKQDYAPVADSVWFPVRQEFTYETKTGRRKTFKGKTVLHYSNYEPNYIFPPKFFNSEVSITTKEAYERDSLYWDTIRPEPLSIKEQRLVFEADSIKMAHNKKEYKDSIELLFNKVKITDVLYDGIAWRSHEKKTYLSIASLPSMIDLEIIGGWRIGQYINYSKRFNSGQLIWIWGSADIGIRNTDIKGRTGVYVILDPYNQLTMQIDVGRRFTSINPNDAYLNQISRSNYVLNDSYAFYISRELFNGFYGNASFSQNSYQSFENYKFGTWIDQYLEENEPVSFIPYQTVVTKFGVSYTPFQKYITEPDRKRVLGSAYPTLSVTYNKGWRGLLESAVDFDFMEVELKQSITLGAMGNSKYSIKTGKFLNSASVQLLDVKRFRQSDILLFSNSLESFQLLDTAMNTTKPYIEMHYIHHFNGAIMNFVPFIKQLRIRTVGGAGALRVEETNFQMAEIYLGLERVFKLGKRRRLRLGIYGVAADSNFSGPSATYKVSFDIVDTWKRDWSF